MPASRPPILPADATKRRRADHARLSLPLPALRRGPRRDGVVRGRSRGRRGSGVEAARHRPPLPLRGGGGRRLQRRRQARRLLRRLLVRGPRLDEAQGARRAAGHQSPVSRGLRRRAARRQRRRPHRHRDLRLLQPADRLGGAARRPDRTVAGAHDRRAGIDGDGLSARPPRRRPPGVPAERRRPGAVLRTRLAVTRRGVEGHPAGAGRGRPRSRPWRRRRRRTDRPDHADGLVSAAGRESRRVDVRAGVPPRHGEHRDPRP